MRRIGSRWWSRIVTGVLLVATFAGVGCSGVSGFDRSLNSIVRPYVFSMTRWELDVLPHTIDGWVFPGPEQAADIATVNDYFSTIDRMKALETTAAAILSGDRQGDVASVESQLDTLRQETEKQAPTVERIIGEQIAAVLAEQGIYNPLLKVNVSFPPVSFKLSAMPKLLVVSPLDRIESMRGITLNQGLSLTEITDIEAGVDKLGVSSLVVDLGGLGGTLPTLVSNDYGLRFAVDTAAHEWLHVYLAFAPLGFSYVLDQLGLSPSYDAATIDETVTDMVSREIGALVWAKYYSPADASNEQAQQQTQQPAQEPAFDFNAEMRQIRLAVDDYLARGEVEQAEQFMEEKREYLAANGYYIRKLNQAYFAFYGTYADSPTSVSPIGEGLKQLRSRSTSVKEFLDRALKITSLEELEDSLTLSP